MTVAEASVFTAVAPVSAALLAALVLGEPIGLRQAAGVACVLVAIAVLTWGGALRPLAAR